MRSKLLHYEAPLPRKWPNTFLQKPMSATWTCRRPVALKEGNMSSMSFEVRDPLRHKRTLSPGSPGREDMMVSSFLHSSYSAMTSAEVLNPFNWNRHCSSLIHFTPEKDRVSHRTHASRFCEAGRGEEAIVKCTFRMRAGSTRLNRYSSGHTFNTRSCKVSLFRRIRSSVVRTRSASIAKKDPRMMISNRFKWLKSMSPRGDLLTKSIYASIQEVMARNCSFNGSGGNEEGLGVS